jgi:hypothetical protein
MPSIPFYADQADFDWLVWWRHSEADIAWIVGDGPGRWRAVATCGATSGGTYCLWHTPSGPLPRLVAIDRKPSFNPIATLYRTEVVSDPWAGWEEGMTVADPPQPYFGAGHPGVIWPKARIRGSDGPDAIGMSSFEWIGNRYRSIRKGAPDVTEKWWQRLRRQVKKRAVCIPREGPIDGPKAEILALPSALRRIQDGAIRDVNPA